MASNNFVLNSGELEQVYVRNKDIADALGVKQPYEGPVNKILEGIQIRDADLSTIKQIGGENLTIRHMIKLGITQPDQRIHDNNSDTALAIDKAGSGHLLDVPIRKLGDYETRQIAAFPNGNSLLLSAFAMEAILTTKGLVSERPVPTSAGGSTPKAKPQ